MKWVSILGPKIDITALYTACGFRSNKSFSMISEWPIENDSIQLWGKTSGTINSKNVELSEYVKESVYGRCIFVRVNPITETLINTDEKEVRTVIGMQTGEDEDEDEEDDELPDEVDDEDEREEDDEDEDEREEDHENKDDEDDGQDIGSLPFICPDKELCEEEYLSYSDDE